MRVGHYCIQTKSWPSGVAHVHTSGISSSQMALHSRSAFVGQFNSTFREQAMKHTTGNDGWWDIRRSAEHLGVSVAFLRKAVRKGQVPYARAGSKALRFRREELDRWMWGNGSGDQSENLRAS